MTSALSSEEHPEPGGQSLGRERGGCRGNKAKTRTEKTLQERHLLSPARPHTTRGTTVLLHYHCSTIIMYKSPQHAAISTMVK